MAKSATRKAGGGSLIWLQGLACGALAALAPATALQAGILLLPAIAALMLDRNPGKPVARAVLLCALAACVDPVRTLWNSGQGLSAGLSMLAGVHAVAVAWTAAAAGWLLTQLIPLGVGFALDAAASTQVARLRKEREMLIQEWGIETPADQ